MIHGGINYKVWPAVFLDVDGTDLVLHGRKDKVLFYIS